MEKRNLSARCFINVTCSIFVILFSINFAYAEVSVSYDQKVLMEDGTLLSTDIYLPDGGGSFPTLLMRTPYDNFDPGTGYFFAEHGYAVVLQDVRGKYDSDGSFYPLVNEAEDGYATQKWCAAQPWCNGKIGTLGGSYVGATQWLASTLGNENLVCLFPYVAASEYFGHWMYNSGAFALSVNIMWGIVSVSSRVGQDMSAQPLDWPEVFKTLPLKDLPDKLGRKSPWFTEWLKHPLYDDYWKGLSIARKYEQIKVPAFNVGGWYDIFLEGTLENYRGMRERGGSQEAREGQRLLVGPWFHTSSATTKLGQVEFGPAAAVDLQKKQLQWFNYWLKGEQSALMTEKPVQLFIMGDNEYRGFDNWPPAASREMTLFLGSGKGANSILGDGTLSEKAPAGKKKADSYMYDPGYPVPTMGGNACCREEIVTQGPYDQRPVERRDDVLVYTTGELSDKLTVIGPVKVKLWVSSSAVNTDFTAKLCDVYPDGRSINITSGIIRAPQRNGLDRWEELEPGKACEVTIDLRPTAIAFQAGHRVRLEVSSSNFPRFARSMNTTGADQSNKTEWVIAEQNVFHGGDMKSALILPVFE